MSITSENGILNRGYQYVKTTLEPDTPTVQDDKAAEKEFGLLERGTQFIKNTLEPSNIDEDAEIDEARRKLLRTGAATTGLVGLAGCAGQSQPATSTTQKQENSTQDTEEPPEETDEGLQTDATWRDVDQAEIEAYRSNGLVNEALNGMNKSFLKDSDLTNPREFQEAFKNTLYNTVEETLGEGRSQASSSLIQSGAAAVNLALIEELQNNPDYTDFEAKVIPYINNGHGRGYVASTDHPLTVVDSNTRNAGTVDEEPLQDRDINKINDILVEFQDTNFDEIEDRTKRARYHGFPGRIYSSPGDSNDHIGFDPSVIDDIYEQAVFAETGETFMTSFRDAYATLRYLWENDHFEDKYAGISLNSTPEELPERTEYDSFNEYAEDLTENDIIKHPSRQGFVRNILDRK